MRISSLALTDIRRYREQEIALAPGLTVIRGPNESGKSTIQRAIELALTRRVTSTHSDLDALVPWDGDPESRSAVALVFSYEDEEGEVHEARLAKAFRGPKGQARLEVDGTVITDPAKVDEELAALSGVPTEGFFRSTASIRHHELSELQRDEAALRDRLQASISGADRGTSRAKKKLERALHDLQTKGAKNPGQIKVAEDNVAELETRFSEGEDQLARLEADRDALVVAHDRRSESETALAERRALLEKARQAERLTAERAAASERFERFRESVVVRDEIDELERSHPSSIPLPVLRTTVERLRTVVTRITTLQKLLEGEVQVDFEVPPEVRWRHLSRWSLVLVVIGILIAAAAFAVDALGIIELGTLPILAGGVVAAIGLVLAVGGWWRRRSDRIEKQLRDVEVDRRLRGRSDMELELRQAEAERVDLLGRIGLEDMEAADAALAAEESHVGAIEQRRARLSGLIGEEPLDTLPQRRDSAALEIEQKTAAIEALGPIAKEPRARERLEVEVSDAEAALERARDDEANARARVEQNPVDAEEVAATAERLAMAREGLEAVRRRMRVYALTLTEINRAEQATMERATRYLERTMVADVERITDGRYRRVRVDDANLGIDVFAPERGGWVPVTSLSQGTLDIVYLAARLGLVRLVTGDRRPPLILDDPFVTLDDARAARAFELLRGLAAGFQVIYLTTSDRYDDLAEHVVELAGPTAVDDGLTEDPEDPEESRQGAQASEVASA